MCTVTNLKKDSFAKEQIVPAIFQKISNSYSLNNVRKSGEQPSSTVLLRASAN